MADPLVVWGAGGHAKVVIEAALASDPSRQIVIVDDDPSARDREILRFRVSGPREWLVSEPSAPVALGIGDNGSRLTALDWLQAQGRRAETIIHPSAIVGSTVRIGDGSFLAAGAIVIADACIGRGVIVNTAASVDHDCVIGDGAHIGPGVRLCGNVQVGSRSLVGVGTSVRPNISIGDDVIIGAGSAVVCHLSGPSRYAGCPARSID